MYVLNSSLPIFIPAYLHTCLQYLQERLLWWNLTGTQLGFIHNCHNWFPMDGVLVAVGSLFVQITELPSPYFVPQVFRFQLCSTKTPNVRKHDMYFSLTRMCLPCGRIPLCTYFGAIASFPHKLCFAGVLVSMLSIPWGNDETLHMYARKMWMQERHGGKGGVAFIYWLWPSTRYVPINL